MISWKKLSLKCQLMLTKTGGWEGEWKTVYSKDGLLDTASVNVMQKGAFETLKDKYQRK
jgi:hypothetical protein